MNTVSVLGRVDDASDYPRLPLYSSQPSAGFPAPADDAVEHMLDINDLVVKNPTATFFIRVAGDSMEGAKIFSGDVLVVDRSVSPKDGVIVVAAVYGELVVKCLKSTGHTFQLVSAHDAYEPIVLEDNDECYIWGVVIGSVRQF